MTTASDLRKKLELERELMPKLSRYNQKVVREFTRRYASLGLPLDTQPFDEELSTLLHGHYRETWKRFDGTVSREMPEGAEPTNKEKEAIAAALAAFLLKTSKSRAAEINRTTDTDIGTAVRMAQETQKPDQPHLTRVETAFIAAGLLDRVLSSRSQAAAVTETQLAAESVKATEAEVLLGLNPTISGGDPKGREAMKRWDSVGDNRVREAHLEADGQEVPVSQPFIVDGESLMYPGDTSLGAGPGNVINCRCSASYDTEDIANQRLEE